MWKPLSHYLGVDATIFVQSQNTTSPFGNYERICKLISVIMASIQKRLESTSHERLKSNIQAKELSLVTQCTNGNFLILCANT